MTERRKNHNHRYDFWGMPEDMFLDNSWPEWVAGDLRGLGVDPETAERASYAIARRPLTTLSGSLRRLTKGPRSSGF